MPRSPSPILLFPPEGAEAFLNDLLDERVGEARAQPMNAMEQALSADALASVVAEARVALALWALPDMPAHGVAATLGLPVGAHPIRVEAHLQAGSGDDTYESACDEWRERTTEEADLFWRRRLTSRDDSALVRLYRIALAPSLNRRRAQQGDGSYRFWASIMAEELASLLGAAARLHALGPEALERDPVPPEARRAARAVVVEAFRRHAADEPMPLPALSGGDILTFASSPVASVRMLGVVLAASVETKAPPRAEVRR